MKQLKYEYLLPLGSIVRLKGGKKKIMVCGYMQTGVATGEKVFDYVAVSYPEGLYDSRLKIAFDHSDIEEVVFRGYENDEWKAFLLILEIAARKMQAVEGSEEA